MSSIVPTENLQREISFLADQCVKCGLCSAQCPTYKLHADENESPRGRIALAQAVASGGINSFERITHHLDNCLYCGQCEVSCPSGVKYTRIVDLTLDVLKHNVITTKAGRLEQWAIRFISHQTENRWRKLSKVWSALIPFSKKYLQQKYRIHPCVTDRRSPDDRDDYLPGNRKSIKSLSIFTGCMSHFFDQQTLADSLAFLRHCGFELHIPEQQRCCGALAKHRGFLTIANKCQDANTQTFSKTENTPIIFSATGCGAALQQYEPKIRERFVDISDFANQQIDFTHHEFMPLKKKVTIHSPCSQQKSMTKLRTIETLLRNIPEVEILNTKPHSACCGAGGSHFMRNPKVAAQIREPLINNIIEQKPDYIVSSNYSCAMHIASGFAEKKVDIPVIHPISLLWQQLNKG